MLIKDHAIPCVPCHLHTLHMQLTLSEITWRITAGKKTAHTHTFTCSTIFQAITMVMIIFYVEWCGPHFSFAIMANSRTIYISLSLSLSAVQFAFVDVECDRSHSRVLFNFSTDPVRFCHKTPNLFCRLFFVVCVCLSFSFSRSFLSSQH